MTRTTATPFTRTGNVVRYTFDDVPSFVDAAERESALGTNSSSRAERGGSWAGTDTFAEALRIARAGWPEGRERVERIASRITAEVSSSLAARETYTPSVAAGVFDIGAYLTGDPECFYMVEDDSTTRTGTQGPIVRIVANLAASAGVSADALMARGAMIVALIDALERVGRRVEVIGTFVTNVGSAGVEVVITVKRPEDAVQVDALAFVLAHPAAYRRLGFSLWEQAPADIRRTCHITGYGSGYGQASEIKETGDVRLPAADLYRYSGLDDDAQAAKWVTAELAKQGVKIADE